jgi:amino acid transporter
MYALFHPEYSYESWHVLIAYFACSWIACACVLFGNRLLARINDVGLLLILAGVIITVAVCASMPAIRKQGYSSNRSVWADWQNGTSYSSNGFVFLMGLLNGAFAFGVPGVYRLASLLVKELRTDKKEKTASLILPKKLSSMLHFHFRCNCANVSQPF